MYMLHKKLLGVARKTMLCHQKVSIFHIEVTWRTKLCESQKIMLWQQKKLCEHIRETDVD